MKRIFRHLRGSFSRPPPRAGFISKIFVGQDGVRGLWRVALFLGIGGAVLACLVFALTHFPAAHRWMSAYQATGQAGPSLVLANELSLLLPILAATAALAYLEDRRFTAYGLAEPLPLARLGGGAVTGLACFCLLAAALTATGYNHLAFSGLPAATILDYGLIWAVVIGVAGFTEEFVFRGYLLATLARRIGFWPAAVLTSVLFGASHGMNTGETPVGLIMAGIAGLVFCFAIRRTGSLWWAIGFHSAWDYTESFIFGSHDSGQDFAGRLLDLAPHGNIYFSGGKTGPEGSLFCLLAFAAAVGIILVLEKRQKT